MAEPILSVDEAKDEDTGRLSFCFIWEFPASIAPKLGTPLKGEATWTASNAAAYPDAAKSVKRQNLEGAITAWAAPPPAGDAPPAEPLVSGANLYLDRQFFGGKLEVRIDWTVAATGETKSHKHERKLGMALNASEVVDLDTFAPVLSYAVIAEATEEEKAAAKTSEAVPSDAGEAHAFFGRLIEEALKGIHQKLRAGLGHYWRAMGKQCTNDAGDKALSELRGSDELAKLTMTQLDECWAQLAAELFAGSCYAGPGSYMGLSPWPGAAGASGHQSDARFCHYVRYRARGAAIPDTDVPMPDAADRGEGEYVVALCYACQQLATAVVMSRSEDYHTLANNPLYCRPGDQFGDIPGKATYSGAVPREGTELHKKGWLVPGACYFVKDIKHIAPVLRAFQSTQIQMLDTGACHFNPHPYPARTPKDQPGNPVYPHLNYDTRGEPKLPVASDGVVVPPALAKDKLSTAIECLHHARPLGVARLMVYKRGAGEGKDAVLYVSRKLFMHEGSGAGYRYYSIQSLLNSLRGCPHADLLDVRWQLWTPLETHSVRKACVEGRDSRWWENDPLAKTKETMELNTDNAGKPRVYQRNGQGVHAATRFANVADLEQVRTPDEIAAARGKYRNLAAVDDANLPPYFRK